MVYFRTAFSAVSNQSKSTIRRSVIVVWTHLLLDNKAILRLFSNHPVWTLKYCTSAIFLSVCIIWQSHRTVTNLKYDQLNVTKKKKNHFFIFKGQRLPVSWLLVPPTGYKQHSHACWTRYTKWSYFIVFKQCHCLCRVCVWEGGGGSLNRQQTQHNPQRKKEKKRDIKLL